MRGESDWERRGKGKGRGFSKRGELARVRAVASASGASLPWLQQVWRACIPVQECIPVTDEGPWGVQRVDRRAEGVCRFKKER